MYLHNGFCPLVGKLYNSNYFTDGANFQIISLMQSFLDFDKCKDALVGFQFISCWAPQSEFLIQMVCIGPRICISKKFP